MRENMTKNNKIGHKLFSILLILGIFFTSCENPSGPNSPVNPIGANDGAKDNDGNVTSSLVNAEKKAGDDGCLRAVVYPSAELYLAEGRVSDPRRRVLGGDDLLRPLGELAGQAR